MLQQATYSGPQEVRLPAYERPQPVISVALVQTAVNAPQMLGQ